MHPEAPQCLPKARNSHPRNSHPPDANSKAASTACPVPSAATLSSTALNTLVPLGRGPARAAMAHQPVIILDSWTMKKLVEGSMRGCGEDGRALGWGGQVCVHTTQEQGTPARPAAGHKAQNSASKVHQHAAVNLAGPCATGPHMTVAWKARSAYDVTHLKFIAVMPLLITASLRAANSRWHR